MRLRAAHIYKTLSEWPNRWVGSENEMMAREALITELSIVPDLQISEEGLRVPKSNARFIQWISVLMMMCVWMSSTMPYISLLLGGTVYASFILQLDYRWNPVIWFMPTTISANLTAKQGYGKRLFLIMAHIDCMPNAFVDGKEVKALKSIIFYCFVFVLFFGVLFPVLFIAGYEPSLFVMVFFSLFIGAGCVLHTYPLHKEDIRGNVTGVSAAVATTTELWANMPEKTEVRLLVTTAHGAGAIGALRYLKQHEEAFAERDIYVLNYDTLERSNIAYAEQAGVITTTRYETILNKVADSLVKLNPLYRKIAKIDVGDKNFDTVWFARKKHKVITLTSKEASDTNDAQDYETMAKFGEAILRLLPATKDQ